MTKKERDEHLKSATNRIMADPEMTEETKKENIESTRRLLRTPAEKAAEDRVELQAKKLHRARNFDRLTTHELCHGPV